MKLEGRTTVTTGTEKTKAFPTKCDVFELESLQLWPVPNCPRTHNTYHQQFDILLWGVYWNSNQLLRIDL